MEFGLVGLGRIGSSFALHAAEKGHQVVGYDRAEDAAARLGAAGITSVTSLAELAERLPRPRIIIVYVPHGAPTHNVITELLARLQPGDLLADGGNSHWKDSMAHYQQCKARNVSFLDIGTSGGVGGARHGACFMVGGDRGAFERLEPLLRDLAVPDGVVYVGPAGSGHFVKLVHNGIEFGMVQAIGEGVDLLTRSDFPLDLPRLFENWSHGSVIRGWLVELMAQGLREHGLESLSGYVEDTREVKWLVEYALEKEAWTPVIVQSEMAFYRYRDLDSISGKAVALLRHGFGGHPLHRKQ